MLTQTWMFSDYSATISGGDLFDRTLMQEYEQHPIGLGIKPGYRKDCFHPYKKREKGRGGHQCQPPPPTNIYYQPMPAAQYMVQQPFFPTPTRVVAEVVAGDAAVGVTLTVASSNSLLNDTYQTVLPSRNPAQRPMTLSDNISPQGAPPEGEKTECYNPTGEGRDSLFSYLTGGGKDSLFSNPQEGVKTPCGGRDPLCTVSWCIYPRSSSETIKPSSGKQAKIVPASMENLRCTPLNTKPHRGRIQTTLQGGPNLVQDTMHSQWLHRLHQTKCLVNVYARLATVRRSQYRPKSRQSRFLQSPVLGPRTRQLLEARSKAQGGDSRIHTSIPQEE